MSFVVLLVLLWTIVFPFGIWIAFDAGKQHGRHDGLIEALMRNVGESNARQE